MRNTFQLTVAEELQEGKHLNNLIMSSITNATTQTNNNVKKAVENKTKLYSLLFNGVITMKGYFNAVRLLNQNSEEKV